MLSGNWCCRLMVLILRQNFMNNETIALFSALLSKAYWEIDYYRFLEITGFVDDLYAIEKFKTFQLAVKQLNQFDP